MGERALYGATTLAFAASVAGTVAWCRSLPASGCLAVPGLEVSMAWLRMPGQSLQEAVASFVGMWTLMMAAMMLPSLAPVLQRYGRAAGNAWMTLPVAAGYFLAWAFAGVAIYPVGAGITWAQMESSALAGLAPAASGVAVFVAGLVQFTPWKAHYLACCRGELAYARLTAWRYGMRQGVHCILACVNLMVILMVLGLMDLFAMTAVAAAITFERFGGRRAAHAVGVLACAFGMFAAMAACFGMIAA